MGVQRNAEQLSQIADIVDQGQVKPFITERLPLKELAAVHEKVGQTRGKVLLLVNDLV
jgi:NADPH:quinone reductase-like Zn-dependent oxidoreductase